MENLINVDVPLKTDETTGKALSNIGFTLKMKSGVKAGQYVEIRHTGLPLRSIIPIPYAFSGPIPSVYANLNFSPSSIRTFASTLA